GAFFQPGATLRISNPMNQNCNGPNGQIKAMDLSISGTVIDSKTINATITAPVPVATVPPTVPPVGPSCPSARDITVFNPDVGPFVCSGCFTINGGGLVIPSSPAPDLLPSSATNTGATVMRVGFTLPDQQSGGVPISETFESLRLQRPGSPDLVGV